MKKSESPDARAHHSIQVCIEQQESGRSGAYAHAPGKNGP